MGRRLRIDLDRVHPTYTLAKPTELTYRAHYFHLGDWVFGQNFGGGSSIVTQVKGPQSYMVAISDGCLWHRHIDQLRKRCRQERAEADRDPQSETVSPNILTDDESEDHPLPTRNADPNQSPDSPPSCSPSLQTTPHTPVQEALATNQHTAREPVELRRSTRIRRHPTYLDEYACAIQGEGVSHLTWPRDDESVC